MLNKKVKIAGIIIVILIIAYGGGSCIVAANKASKIQHNMQEYLQKNYGKEFVVGRLMLTGNEGFGYSTYVAEAYPKDNPALKTQVVWEKGEPGKYYDYYNFDRVSEQGRKEIAAFLKGVYAQDVSLTYTLSTPVKELQGLEHDELLTKHGKDTRLDLTYYVFVDKVDKAVEAEKAYKVLKKFVLDNHPKYYFVTVYYHPNSYKDEFNKGFNQDTTNFLNAYDSEKLYKENKLLNYLHADYDSSIKDKKDLEELFKY